MKKKKKSEVSIADHLRMARSKVPQHLDSRAEPGTRRAKRVRFEEPDTQHPLTCSPNVSLISGNPKTSEYAFYKKLRQDASHFSNRHRPHKQVEESEARKNHTQGVCKIAKPNYEVRSFSPMVKETPTALVSTISPRVSASSGSECKYKDIFLIKREKLIHLAADSLSLDMDTICSKGYDLVPMLLQRLHPDSNAITETSCSRSRSKSIDTKFNNDSELHVSLDSDIHVKEIPWTPSVNLVSPFHRENLESSLLHSWSDTPKVTSCLQEFGEDWGLTRHASEIIINCERTHVDDIVVDCSQPASLYANMDSDFSIKPGAEFHASEDGRLALDYMPNQRSLVCPTFGNLSPNAELSDKSCVINSNASFQWSESDGISSPNMHTSLNKQHKQLLHWSPRTVEKEEYFSSSSHVAELNTSLTWGTVSEDYLHSPNSVYKSTGSDRSILQCSDLSLRTTSPGIYLTDTVGSQYLGEVGSMLTWHPNQIILQRDRSHLDDVVDCTEPSSGYAEVDSDFRMKLGAEFQDCLALDYMPNRTSLLYQTYKGLPSDSGVSSDTSLMLNSSSSFKVQYVLSSPNILASLGKQDNQILSWSPSTVEKEEYFSNAPCDAELYTRSPAEDNTHSPKNSIFSPAVRSICYNTDLTLMNMPSGNYLTDTVGLHIPDVTLTWRACSPSEDNLHSPNNIFSPTGMHSPSVQSIHHCSDLILRNMSPGKYLGDSVDLQTPNTGNYQVEDPGDFPLQLWRCQS